MSELEKLISGIVMVPDINEIVQIEKLAMEEKEQIFKEMGWETMNHKINTGDVKCVLSAILKLAEQQRG